MNAGSNALPYTRYTKSGLEAVEGAVIEEMPLTIYVNGRELVTLLCTPNKLNCLVFGFLSAEGIITSPDEVSLLRICEEDELADVRLNHEIELPAKRTLTSGCGGGTTFADLSVEGARLESSLRIAPQQVFRLMRELQRAAHLYRLTGGVHVSALSDGHQLLVVTEDVGRHNTLDKIRGECLLRELPMKDGIILTTGRISSEMLLKTAKMEVPVIISRTSPTSLAIKLAREWGVTLIGYVRAGRMNVYAGEERLLWDST